MPTGGTRTGSGSCPKKAHDCSMLLIGVTHENLRPIITPDEGLRYTEKTRNHEHLEHLEYLGA
jgi:hypothetical protein